MPIPPNLGHDMAKSAKRGAKVGGKPTLPEPLKSRAVQLAGFVVDEKFGGNQSQAARAMKVSQPTVSAWVSGASSPQMANLQKLARMAHLRFDSWLAGEDPKLPT